MEYKRHIITAAVVNFRPAFGNKELNLSRMAEFSEAAARRGADLVLFPEMCLMGYDYFISDSVSREERIAATETVSGPSTEVLSKIAKKYGIYIVFGMSEKETEQSETLYNTAVVLGPEGLIGRYRKIHPFAQENTWCAKGDEPFLFETEWGPIGVGICYDSYRFPELIRYYAHKGARLYLNPTAVEEPIHLDGSRESFIRSYKPHLEYGVLANCIFIASSNLTGFDGHNYYAGGSMIIGPRINKYKEVGVACCCGGVDDDQAGIHMASLDLSLAKRKLYENNPWSGSPDFRPEIYRKLYE